MEKDRRGQPERPPFEIRHFRSTEPGDRTRYKALALDGFSSGAIKEMLSQMVWGFNPGKGIAFIPRDSETGEAEIVTAEDLYQLQTWPREERLSQVDIEAMRIKGSQAAIMVEKYIE